MNKKYELFVVAFALSISACSTFDAVKEVQIGSQADGVLNKYGAPEKVQKVLNFEVWSYNSGNEVCQLFFQKQTLTEPVKCYEAPAKVSAEKEKSYSLLR